MCNRYVPPDMAEMEREWHIGARDVPSWPREIFPRSPGPFLRHNAAEGRLELVVGQWGLVPFFAKSPKLPYQTNNCRSETAATAATFRDSWKRGQRCIIPAASFDEPNWESGKNQWWRFRRADGHPWGLAGLWNSWRDPSTNERMETYTLLTMNADAHPLMSRMHKPDPKLPADQQDKRSVVILEPATYTAWLQGSPDEAKALIRLAPLEVFSAGPMEASPLVAKSAQDGQSVD